MCEKMRRVAVWVCRGDRITHTHTHTHTHTLRVVHVKDEGCVLCCVVLCCYSPVGVQKHTTLPLLSPLPRLFHLVRLLQVAVVSSCSISRTGTTYLIYSLVLKNVVLSLILHSWFNVVCLCVNIPPPPLPLPPPQLHLSSHQTASFSWTF